MINRDLVTRIKWLQLIKQVPMQWQIQHCVLSM